MGAIALAVTQRFLEAGVNLVLLVEESRPPTSTLELWRSILNPVVNVTRFHQAAPVVVTGDTRMCGSIPVTVGACTPDAGQLGGPPNRVRGVALPPDTKGWLPLPGPVPLVTTVGAVPATATFASVLDACRQFSLRS